MHYIRAVMTSLSNHKKLWPLIEINLATLVLGTSGPLGRMTMLPPALIIWFRCLLGVLALYVILRYITKETLRVDLKHHARFFIITGMLMGLHWVSYFYALQLSNVALAQISMFTFPVFTTLIEPLMLKSRFSVFNFIAALLVLTGIVIMVPEFSLQSGATLGVLTGMGSALVFAFRNVMNKPYMNIYSGTVIMFYQLIIVSVMLIPTVVYFDEVNISQKDLWVVLALGFFTTATGHTLFTRSFKNFKVSTASIINGMTPIYGVILAYLWLDEVPAQNTLIGGSLIILTVVMENIRSYHASRQV